MIAAYDLDEPYVSTDPGDRDEHLVAHLRRETPRVVEHGWSDLAWIGQTDKRDAIRIYARLGLHPIAVYGLDANRNCTCPKGAECRTAGKHPIGNGWEKKSLDLDALDRKLSADWRTNIGLRMGAQPNGMFLIAIDCDGDRSILEPLEAEHGALPETLTHRSGSGGSHLLYRVPAERAPRNRVKLQARNGKVSADIRSAGGMIVAAPSLHHTGTRYTWVNARQPEELYQ